VNDTTSRAATVRASHCEQAQAGYYYCQATVNDPCGPGQYPHAYCQPGACIAGTPEAAAHAVRTREYLLALARAEGNH
jgi:hypothetical protein